MGRVGVVQFFAIVLTSLPILAAQSAMPSTDSWIPVTCPSKKCPPICVKTNAKYEIIHMTASSVLQFEGRGGTEHCSGGNAEDWAVRLSSNVSSQDTKTIRVPSLSFFRRCSRALFDIEVAYELRI